jgi:hypothetical protein
MDIIGFHGQTEHFRKKIKLVPITENDFLQVFTRENKLKEIMLSIRSIDPIFNGIVTRNELDDILKLHHSKELDNKDLMPLMKRFASVQNKILIDYKGFMQWIKNNMIKS